MTFANLGLTSDGARNRLIESLRRNQLASERVLEVLALVPRHAFVDSALAYRAYDDTVLPIPAGQTILQPTVVALMSEAAATAKGHRKVLEIGTGCGYQTAILSHLFEEVYTVERIQRLSLIAQQTLDDLRLTNIAFEIADGHFGWQEHAPYDVILCTAACDCIPADFMSQLAAHGRLVVPVASGHGNGEDLVVQDLVDGEHVRQTLASVKFVPMRTGVQT